MEILFNDPVQIAGYRTRSCYHDDDNLAYWVGLDNVLGCGTTPSHACAAD